MLTYLRLFLRFEFHITEFQTFSVPAETLSVDWRIDPQKQSWSWAYYIIKSWCPTVFYDQFTQKYCKMEPNKTASYF